MSKTRLVITVGMLRYRTFENMTVIRVFDWGCLMGNLLYFSLTVISMNLF